MAHGPRGNKNVGSRSYNTCDTCEIKVLVKDNNRMLRHLTRYETIDIER
jgi:hypothetical protein